MRFDGDATARIGVLGGVGEQVGDDLREAPLVSIEAQLGGGEADVEMIAALLEERHRDLRPLGHDVLQAYQALLDLDRAAGDAGDVEQIVNEPNQVLNLALDDLQRLAVLTITPQLQQLNGGHDGRERVAELVTEHGEEFVFGSVGLSERLG